MTPASVPTSPPVVRIGANAVGDRQWLVPSDSGSAAAKSVVYHVVVEECGRLTCACPAATFVRVCRHQRAVADLLLADTRAAIERLSAAPPAHESAAPHRDNRAFSIWK
jgi:hypothetical protein